MKQTISGKMWRDALLVLGRMTGWIATPVLIAVFIGRRLDVRYDSGNKWFLVFIFGGFLLSLIGIYLEMRKYIRAMEREEKAKEAGAEQVTN